MLKQPKSKTSKSEIKAREEDLAAQVIPQPAAPILRGYEGEAYDIMLHAFMAKLTCWISPSSIGLAIFDWLSHLTFAPAKQFDLAHQALNKLIEFNTDAMSQVSCNASTKSRPKDPRFKADEWETYPFNLYAQYFLLNENLWDEATTSIRGVSKHHENVINFTTRQILDVFSPSNFPTTNPEIIAATIREGGLNFVRGFNNLMEDHCRTEKKLPPVGAEKFQVGKNVAITPGKVIYRNSLIELIQYEPTTSEVYAEPILIVPAWIMKYYILDLSPHNSLVKYLVDNGHTVFMISWKNPDSNDRDLDLDDYLNLGIMNALDAINQIVPHQKINATGYCLGGTLLTIAAAAMALAGDDRLNSVTLFAAQVDFRNPGDLSLFIDQSQISYLEDAMWEKGYLDGPQMSNAFSMLRSNDLIWSRMIHDYLLGKRRPLNDLIAWDHDTTRLPYRMHSDYLHNLFLNNDLVHGRYKANKKKIALMDIQIPLFVVATTKDHVSPWRSVYKIQLYTNTDLTFVLTSGGHNAGIVNEPGHKNRTYQIATHKKNTKHISSDQWVEKTPKLDGSWWPVWEKWLNESSAGKVSPPLLGNNNGYTIICDAPGAYVLQK
jgi:polyhydroxyalkanoate synthase